MGTMGKTGLQEEARSNAAGVTGVRWNTGGQEEYRGYNRYNKRQKHKGNRVTG